MKKYDHLPSPTALRIGGFTRPAHVYCRECGDNNFVEYGTIRTDADAGVRVTSRGVEVGISPSEIEYSLADYHPTGYGCATCGADSDDIYDLIAIRAWRIGDAANDDQGRLGVVEEIGGQCGGCGGRLLRIDDAWYCAADLAPDHLPQRDQLRISPDDGDTAGPNHLRLHPYAGDAIPGDAVWP